MLESRQGGFVAWCAGFLDSDDQSVTFPEPLARSGDSFRGVPGSPGHPVRGLEVVHGVVPSAERRPGSAPNTQGLTWGVGYPTSARGHRSSSDPRATSTGQWSLLAA